MAKVCLDFFFLFFFVSFRFLSIFAFCRMYTHFSINLNCRPIIIGGSACS